MNWRRTEVTDLNRHLPCLMRQLLKRAREQPGTLALAFPGVLPDQPDRELTWSALEASVSQAGSLLAAVGARAGEVVLVLTPETHEQVLAFLGAIAVGAVPSILSYPSVKQSEGVFLRTLRPIIEKTKAQYIVCSDQYADMAKQFHLTRLPCPIVCQQAPTFEFSPARDATFLQFSSGTTGLRKGIVVTEEMLQQQMSHFGRALSLGPEDAVAGWVPLYHDMGLVGGFLLPLFHGIPSVHISPFAWLQRPVSLLEAVSKYRATIIYLPNFAYGFLADRVTNTDQLAASNITLKSLRAVINCSEPVRFSAHEKFVSRFASLGLDSLALQASYAMAENTLAVTMTRVGRPLRLDRVDRQAFSERHECVQPADSKVPAMTFVSCGYPLENTKVRIAGGTHERRVGEIEIKGDSLFQGYWRSEHSQATEGPFTADGWYRTGDLGYLAEGELFVTGRSKDLIISRGANIYPNDIEDSICLVSGVRPGRAVAFGIFDEASGTESVVAICELEDGVDHTRVLERIREEVLAAHGIRLESLIAVEAGALRKSTSGKLSRSANRDLFLERTKSATCLVEKQVNLQVYYKLADDLELSGGRLAGLIWHPAFTRPFAAVRWLRDRIPIFMSASGQEERLQALRRDVEVLRDFENPRVPAGYIDQMARDEAQARELRETLTAAIEVGVLSPVSGPTDDFDPGKNFLMMRRPESDHLVFFFKAAGNKLEDFPALEFARLTGLIHHNLVLLRDPTKRSYLQGISLQLPTFERLLGWQLGYQSAIGARHVHCCGNSLGGYAAIYYGFHLRAEKVWAFGPTRFVGDPPPVDLLRHGNGVTEYHIWYGEHYDVDRDFAESLRGCPGVHLHPVAHDSHLIANVLASQNAVPTLLGATSFQREGPTRWNRPPTLDDICLLLARVAPKWNQPLMPDSPLGGVLDSFTTFQLLALLEERYDFRLDLKRLDSRAFSTPRSILTTVLSHVELPPLPTQPNLS